MKNIQIREADAGQRLDKFLKRYFQNASAGFLYKMLRKKNITLNGRKAAGSELLSCGDEVAVWFSDETFEKMKGDAGRDPRFIEIAGTPHPHVDIVFEDEDILIANKPPGILSQKEKPLDRSLNEELLSYLIDTGFLTEERFRAFHPSVANRLDRNTSGLVLFGKTLHGQQLLSEALRTRTLSKRYQAIVHGEISEKLLLSGVLIKDEKTNTVTVKNNVSGAADQETATEAADAKNILTAVKPLSGNGALTLLEVELLTGRTHQIRAHLSSIGHPLLFDPKYGDAALDQPYRERFPKARQMLHCAEVTLPDGRTFRAEPPEAFRTLAEEIKKDTLDK